MNKVYELAKAFKRKYPGSIGWRLKQHSKVIENHLNPGEEVNYVFFAQKSLGGTSFFRTYVIALTNKRILMATKRVLFGYFYTAITPDMFNDLTVRMGIIWGNVIIDTVKEEVKLSTIQKESLDEIETAVTEYMMEEKKKYAKEGH